MKIKQFLRILCIFTGLCNQMYSFGPLVDIPSNSSCNIANLSHYYAKMNGDLKDHQEVLKSAVNSSSLNDNAKVLTETNFIKNTSRESNFGFTQLKNLAHKKPKNFNRYASGAVLLPFIGAGLYEYMKSHDSKKDSIQVVKDKDNLKQESFNEKELVHQLNDHQTINNQSLVRRILDNKYSPYVGVGLSVALLYGGYLYYTSDEIQAN